MANFATIEDLETLWRPLRESEKQRADSLLGVVSDTLRAEADTVGADLDAKIAGKPFFATVIRQVTVDIVARTLMTSTDQEPMVQRTESALGYSVGGTYLIPGGGLFIKDSELKRLGLVKRQRLGVIEPYGYD